MNDPQVVQLFSQPLYINKVKITDDDINDVITTPCESDNGGYNNGWMSDTQWLVTHPEIRTIVEEHLSHYVFTILAVDKSKHELEHTTSWVNLHKPGDSSGTHNHSNAMFSGVMYFKCPPNSGDIIFRIPSMFPTFCTETLYPEVTEYNQYNMREAKIIPQDGMILCFPSHLEHSVTPNKSSEQIYTHSSWTTSKNDYRYSMAFNYILRGKYGRDDHYLKL
tara:strand:- start:176 stop:838 length:663 start_codon:yes stop_codon:yes gene_type:complete